MKRLFFYTLLGSVLLACSPMAKAWEITIITNHNGPSDQGLRLVSAAPYANEKIAGSPSHVTLTFSQGIKPDKSYVRVYDMYGNKISDDQLVAQGTSLSTVVPDKLPPGKYSVRWKVRCQCDADTEISDRYTFVIK